MNHSTTCAVEGCDEAYYASALGKRVLEQQQFEAELVRTGDPR